ncbi:MAG TPA: hypothetical protein VF017_12515 [Thermoanaerobaculia bacterium]|nr:hypothetical protein [Thermoanaerobaculia bacterium]
MPLTSRFRRHRRSLVLAAAFALFAVGAALLAPLPTEAQTRCGTEIIYFSDPSHTEEIGLRGWTYFECGCQSYGWGSVSSYREVYDSFC